MVEILIPMGVIAYTEAQAAAMLQVAEVTLRKWRYAGKVKHSRIGRLVRYSLQDIEATMEANSWPKKKGDRK